MATPPLSPDVPYQTELQAEQHDTSATPAPSTPQPQSKITRTVAIIKNHALAHRFDIEPRIQEASFEIVKERQMEFDVESDPETLFELFGEDADSLAEGPVWVYVLERRRAVEVWNTLMGDVDPEVARKEAPNSLRALYGISLQQNALMGSPDAEMAEIQISSLFASSPPFPTSDLPPEDGRFASMRSVSSSVLSALRGATSDEGYAPSSATKSSTNGSGSKLAPNGQPLFRARGLPKTHDKPDIVPRITRAAALRAGIAPEKTISPRKTLTKEQMAQTFQNVPGHKRSETITVASTAAPTIAPRMTKAAALRLGQAPPPPMIRQKSSTSFDGVPGHKRRETISVASVAAPTVAPRINKSASLRATKDNAPPTSYMFKGPTEQKVPGLSRSSSRTSLSDNKSSTGRPGSSVSIQRPASRPLTGRSSTTPAITQRQPSRPASALKVNGNGTIGTKANGSRTSSVSPSRASPAKPTLKPRPSSISLPPSIAPRTNKSAALRAAKKEQEAAAAAALAARNKPKPRAARPPPSSMPKGLAV